MRSASPARLELMRRRLSVRAWRLFSAGVGPDASLGAGALMGAGVVGAGTAAFAAAAFGGAGGDAGGGTLAADCGAGSEAESAVSPASDAGGSLFFSSAWKSDRTSGSRLALAKPLNRRS